MPPSIQVLRYVAARNSALSSPAKVATISHKTPNRTPLAASSHIMASSADSGLKRAM